MLEYVKIILEKVSFDKRLFEKELRKALKSLVHVEIQDLQKWCYENYGQEYQKVLNTVFLKPSLS